MTETALKMRIYWANLCILNRMESERMAASAEAWSPGRKCSPEMVYLGDTEEIQMYEQMDRDMAAGKLGFDLLVTTRFDLFCSKKYLQSKREDLFPIGDLFPVRAEIAEANVPDPHGLFFPLAVLPHYIVVNTDLVDIENCPRRLEELLSPKWEGQVFLGATDLPSARSVLFNMWYLFGKEGLETCVSNWRRKSAPSAARHGLVKGNIPVAVLPGIFAGPGPADNLQSFWPEEGAPVLPSYAAVKKSSYTEETIDFFVNSAGSKQFSDFYRNQGFAYPTRIETTPPEIALDKGPMLFPDWDWILDRDMDYFLDACERMPGE